MPAFAGMSIVDGRDEPGHDQHKWANFKSAQGGAESGARGERGEHDAGEAQGAEHEERRPGRGGADDGR